MKEMPILNGFFFWKLNFLHEFRIALKEPPPAGSFRSFGTSGPHIIRNICLYYGYFGAFVSGAPNSFTGVGTRCVTPHGR